MSSAGVYRVDKSTRRTQTCDMCKLRHQKCSGAQPQCNNCELRGISCTYSKKSNTRDASVRSNEQSSSSTLCSLGSSVGGLANLSHRIGASSRPSISSSEYARLYSQIFGDIVRDLNLDRSQFPEARRESFDSRLGNASLPLFYREVYTIVEEQGQIERGQTSSQSNTDSAPINQMRDLALEQNLEPARKILRDSLPHKEVSQHLLDLFFDYQNSIFYVCRMSEAQAQLNLMYEEPNQVSLSWYCQMFLLFSVATQFDELDEAGGVTYHDIGKKYMDDAVEESPQNTLWVIRAMVLLCIYEQPTKWTSIWMYLDAAIRGAQRFQLDEGHNQLQELSDEEYQEWRQLWLTIISFDRWVAIFLGRLPRIKESISRDPVFKDASSISNLEYCVMQNSITSLAIISGNILRGMHFSEEFSLSLCRQYKNELDMWTANLPNPLRQCVDSGMVANMPKGQAEAALNLHFMLLGAWMLLTRPLLLKAIRTRMSPTRFAGPIVSAITSDARACINFAMRLINSATTMLLVPLPPKRFFMPIFFLINAANIVILGIVWKRQQAVEEESMLGAGDQNRHELSAIDAAIKVLDFCGQRSAFARKYSILIKSLRQQLKKGTPTAMSDEMSPPAATARTPYQSSPLFNRPMGGSFEMSSNSSSTDENLLFQNWAGSVGQTSTSQSTSPLGTIDSDFDAGRGYFTSSSSLDAGLGPWSENTGAFHPGDDVSTFDSSHLLQDPDDLNF